MQPNLPGHGFGKDIFILVKMVDFKKLTRVEMKKVLGGDDEMGHEPGGGLTCLSLNSACNDNVQCCSNYCKSGGNGSTGAKCTTSV